MNYKIKEFLAVDVYKNEVKGALVILENGYSAILDFEEKKVLLGNYDDFGWNCWTVGITEEEKKICEEILKNPSKIERTPRLDYYEEAGVYKDKKVDEMVKEMQKALNEISRKR